MHRSEQCLVESWQNTSEWSTEAVPYAKQFDHWCDFVNRAHLTWDIDRNSYDRFPAFIREGRHDDVRLVNLTSAEPYIKGTRRAKQIERDDVALYNLIYISEGSECLYMDDREVELRAGDFTLWDSTRSMRFLTGPGLHQITLCIGHDRLHRALPRVSAFIGNRMSANSGVNRLFIEHLLSLDEQFGALSRHQAAAVLDTTIDLLALTLGSQASTGMARSSGALFERVKSSIERRLPDHDLTIASLSSEHAISPRHLQRLFAERGTSVAKYINQRRLHHCRSELASPALKHVSITEIAFRWGIEDSSQFSKTFKREFGLSPRQFRRDAL